MASKVAPYGTWASLVTPEMVATGSVRLSSVATDLEDIYWSEARPSEAGRNVVVKRRADGEVVDVTPAGTNVRSRVHEYGGAAFVVDRGSVFYSEFSDQRIYRLVPGQSPQPITPVGKWCYADATVDESRRRIICVREDHTVEGREAVTTLVSIDLDANEATPRVVQAGYDFYSTPRLSPDGSRLAWIAWRHPQMPWDGTELWVADVAPDGEIVRPTLVAGGVAESIFQPDWSPDGVLYFVSDRTGWWNLYRLASGRVEAVLPMAAEFGRAQWQFGARTWGFAGPHRLVVAFKRDAAWRLGTIDVPSGRFEPLAIQIEPTESLVTTPTHVVMVGGSATMPDTLVRIDLASGEVDEVRSSSSVTIPERAISVPEAIEFPTTAGLTAHAFYYKPLSPDVVAPPGERPPLVVISHGGPTGATTARLNLEVQYWTSRGFAVVDVNYGGSAGHGRDYRQRLVAQWGIVDVADCVNAARYLVRRGDADEARLIIRGRSAGGYTTLAALAFEPDVFKAGASYYGVGDLELLARDTHKFESRYLDSLIGPYPEAGDLYRARSPINFVHQLSCSLILFQGLEDKVVPPNQAFAMAEAVRAKGLPVELHTFDDEQHGFRKAENVVRCLEAELGFYGRVFGFEPEQGAARPAGQG